MGSRLALLLVVAAVAAAVTGTARATPINPPWEFCIGGQSLYLPDTTSSQVITLGGFGPMTVAGSDTSFLNFLVQKANAGFLTIAVPFQIIPVTFGLCHGATTSPSGIFLCYSKFQTDPGVWDAATATRLVNEGYWMPYAVSGSLAGGTNIGSYHLVCNVAGAQSGTGGFVDAAGNAWPTALSNVLGVYPTAG